MQTPLQKSFLFSLFLDFNGTEQNDVVTAGERKKAAAAMSLSSAAAGSSKLHMDRLGDMW